MSLLFQPAEDGAPEAALGVGVRALAAAIWDELLVGAGSAFTEE
jgi:hypothetical protein